MSSAAPPAQSKKQALIRHLCGDHAQRVMRDNGLTPAARAD
jgi:hypothetical protein